MRMQDHSRKHGRPTYYKGTLMRSRTEADYAGYMDRNHADWSYETDCFANEAGQYLPDFKADGDFVEVKSDEELSLEQHERHADRMARIYGYLERMEIIWASIPRARLKLVFHRYGYGPVGELVASGEASRTWYPRGSLQMLWPSETTPPSWLIERRSRFFIWLSAQRAQDRLCVGEVGHDPPWHIGLGGWLGPSSVPREARQNVSLCGNQLGRALQREVRPGQHDICGICFSLANDRMVSGW